MLRLTNARSWRALLTALLAAVIMVSCEPAYAAAPLQPTAAVTASDGTTAKVTSVEATGKATKLTIRVSNSRPAGNWVYAGVRQPDGSMATITSAVDVASKKAVPIERSKLSVKVPAGRTVDLVVAINQTGKAVVMVDNVDRVGQAVVANAKAASFWSVKPAGNRQLGVAVASSQAPGDYAYLVVDVDGKRAVTATVDPQKGVVTFRTTQLPKGKHTAEAWIDGKHWETVFQVS